ncbi:Monooxygenase [Exophiala dermatitidis]
MAFKSVLPPSTERPKSQSRWPSASRQFAYALRENFSLSTWLLLGALLQSIVVFVVPLLYATVPLILVLGARVVDAMAVTWGWKKNPMLEGALLHRVSPQIPDEDGNFHEGAAEEKVVVFLLGAKANHPLGIFSPNMNTISGFLTGMISNLDDTAIENGFYGGSNWTNQDKNGATEFLFLSYWRSTEDIHKYAYSPLHREAWDWWNKTIKQNDHIGINHEIFEVDRKHWEAIYVNFQPTLLGATTYLRKGDKMMGGTVDDQWISPLLDARRGKLRSSAGRLGRDPGQLYEKYELAPGATREEE